MASEKRTNKKIKSKAIKERGKRNVFTDKLYYLIKSMRPKQWTKNGFVFAGLIFSKSFFDVGLVLKSIYAFILFALVSGAVYIINDIADRRKDVLHPEKCKRPIASGRISPQEAGIYSVLVLAVALGISYALEIKLFLILLSYLCLMLLYSLWLKNAVIVDVLIIAIGFVLRTVGGALAINVKISPWLIMCTTLLALFIALNKRRNELLVLSEEAKGEHRKNLMEYTPELINSMLSVVTSATVMSYSLYTFNAGKSHYMMLTIPFVIYGIFRYQYLTLAKNWGGSPELVLLKDKPLIIDIILWIIISLVIVTYFY